METYAQLVLMDIILILLIVNLVMKHAKLVVLALKMMSINFVIPVNLIMFF